jgi:hypothetical protein
MLLIQQCYCIYMTLLASDRSICIECRICWRMICMKNERNMQQRCCHSCMLPNVTADIILWPVMSRDFSWIYHHVACRLCRKIMWSQSRDLIFRAKIYIHNHMEPEQLLCYGQTLKWCQNEQWLFCDKYIHSIWTNDLSSRKGSASEITCDSSRQLLSSYKSNFNKLARRTWHAVHAINTHPPPSHPPTHQPTYPPTHLLTYPFTHPICLIWPQWLMLVP